MAKRSRVTDIVNNKVTFFVGKMKTKTKKKKETYIDPYNVRDTFIVSMGNLEVLKRVPEMMLIPKWRDQLRKLVLDFICEETLSRNKIVNRELRGVMSFEQRMKRLRK
jgi:hypothetical protein